MYARIKNGKVAEVTGLDPAVYYPATASNWVPCPDGTLPNAEYTESDKSFTAAPYDKPYNLKDDGTIDPDAVAPIPEGEPTPIPDPILFPEEYKAAIAAQSE